MFMNVCCMGLWGSYRMRARKSRVNSWQRILGREVVQSSNALFIWGTHGWRTRCWHCWGPFWRSTQEWSTVWWWHWTLWWWLGCSKLAVSGCLSTAAGLWSAIIMTERWWWDTGKLSVGGSLSIPLGLRGTVWKLETELLAGCCQSKLWPQGWRRHRLRVGHVVLFATDY